MLETYKPGITLFSILAIIIILFPPVIWATSTRILDSGFAFLFYIPKWKSSGIGGTINLSQLLVELIFVFIISLLFQINFQKIKTIFKNNF
jgi:hypothetical protein